MLAVKIYVYHLYTVLCSADVSNKCTQVIPLCIVETIPVILGSILRPVNGHGSCWGLWSSAGSWPLMSTQPISMCDTEEGQITNDSQRAKEAIQEPIHVLSYRVAWNVYLIWKFQIHRDVLWCQT